MLNLKFKIIRVEGTESCSCGRHISVYGVVDLDKKNTDETILSKNILGPAKAYSSDKEIEEEFARNVTKKIGFVLEQIPGMSRPKKEESEAMIAIVITEEMFNQMGRPTVGDYLPITAFAEKQ